MKTVVIIPARLMSSRLPKKAILDICGKPMIQHVYEAVQKAKKISDIFIATDSDEIRAICENFTSNIIMTSSKHESGTDRLAEAVKNIECDNIINVQGDEPLIDSSLIDLLVSKIENEETNMVSAMNKITKTQELISPNVVKVITDKNDSALYFSRSIIPYSREELNNIIDKQESIPKNLNFYKHIGIYGYKKSFLLQYASLEPTYLEQLEKLEQLRVLENGFPIKMVETTYESIGVDTQEDLEKVRALMSNV